jgi:alginate O-acetyltransferase complex protein AlgI
MSIISLDFLYFALAFIFVYLFRDAYNWRIIVLTLFNIGFLVSYSSSPHSLVLLMAFLLINYLFLWLKLKKYVRLDIWLMVLVNVIIFIYLKGYTVTSFLPAINKSFVVIGLSYILFRILQLHIDSNSEEINEVMQPLRYFNFTCSFLTLVSGPIQRFQDFSKQYDELNRHSLNTSLLLSALTRIANGLIKISIISVFLNDFFNAIPKTEISLLSPTASFILSCFSYTLFLYANFSGYMDIVIGLGNIIGIKLPENFNFPFSANNFLEFWNRWHITLSQWFKFYVFNPLSKSIMDGLGNRKVLIAYIGTFAYFVTFLIMGVWHGTTACFLFYGVLLGLGVSINKFYQIWIKNKIGKKKYYLLENNLFYQLVCRAITNTYFAISLACLWNNLEDLFLKIGQIGAMTFIIAVFITIIFVATLWFFFFLTLRFIKKVDFFAIPKVSGNSFAMYYWTSIKYFVLIVFLLKEKAIPGFVYEVF